VHPCMLYCANSIWLPTLLSGVFDVKAVRRALEARVKALEAEKQQVRAQSHNL